MYKYLRQTIDTEQLRLVKELIRTNKKNEFKSTGNDPQFIINNLSGRLIAKVTVRMKVTGGEAIQIFWRDKEQISYNKKQCKSQKLHHDMVYRYVFEFVDLISDAIALRIDPLDSVGVFWIERINIYYEVFLPIVILTMGKVGSTSVYETLKRSYSQDRIHHIHNLSDSVEMVAQNLLKKSAPIPRHIREACFLRKQLPLIKENCGRWKIISLVRDPIGRNISAFFQNIEKTPVRGFINNFTQLYNNNEIDISEIIKVFLERFNHIEPLTWFDRELVKNFNFDVFRLPFDKEKGYQIYDHEKIELLVMRMEDLSKIGSVAIEEFLGLTKVELYNDNISQRKNYYPAYKAFLSEIRFSDDFIRTMYDSKFMKHFYTDKEIQGFSVRWKQNMLEVD